MSEVVSVERVGEVALIILNRPTARNAMNVALAAATCDALDALGLMLEAVCHHDRE